MNPALIILAAEHPWYEYIYNEHLLTEMMAGWPVWLLVIAVAFCLFLLVKGAGWLVEGAVAMAERTRLPKIVIGATIVSIGTTTPECFVSVMGAWLGNPGLALGNGVGSIICDTGLIFGLACLIRPMAVDRFIVNRQGWVQFGAALLLVVLSLALRLVQDTPMLGREIGFMFLALLAVYIYFSIRWSREHGISPEDEELLDAVESLSVPKSLVRLFVGLILIIISSRFIVPSVGELALRIGVPSNVIAATLVAFGTSLPELVTAIAAVRKGHGDLAVGNIIGADVLNVLFVIGAAAAVRPLAIERNFFLFHFPAMMTILILFRVFIFLNREGRFKRYQGGAMLLVYLVYLILQYAFNLGG